MKKYSFLIFAISLLFLLAFFYFVNGPKPQVIAPTTTFPPTTTSLEDQLSCAKEKEKVNRNPLLGSTDVKCCSGLIEWRVSKSYSYCLKPTLGEIVVIEPLTENISNSFYIYGKAKGNWFFEAEFPVQLYNQDNELIAQTNLRAMGDWMSSDFVYFSGSMEFNLDKELLGQKGYLRFFSANPSGLIENQKVFEIPVKFVENKPKAIQLYFYRPDQDKDETGNIKCSEEGLVVIERFIPSPVSPIKDALGILISKGKEILNEKEKSQGITTEFPLERVSLKSVNLKNDGTLIVEIEDPLNKTSGGACRVNILRLQLEKTAKQFGNVKKVEFIPESVFQP